MVEKIKTGISGLDKLTGGGIPEQSVVLLSGSAGSGKTIFSLQFILEGANKYKEKGLYISFEERKEKIVDQAEQFGFRPKELEKKGLVKILSISRLDIGDIFREIKKSINTFKPKRLVIDSLTFMSIAVKSLNRLIDFDKTPIDEIVYETPLSEGGGDEWNDIILRKMMIELIRVLQNQQVTTLLTSEVSKNSEWYSRDTLSEFACDGIILLKAVSIGNELQRTIEVVKMRNTKMVGGVYDFGFSKNGVKIKI